jgi:hypothetical protein
MSRCPCADHPPKEVTKMYKRLFMLASIIIMLFPITGCSGLSKIIVNKTDQNYEVYDPEKRLVFTIPKDGFTMRDLRDENLRAYEPSPSFFYLENRISNLAVSIWFASENIFPGIKKFWEDEMEGWRRVGLPSPQNVSFGKIGVWDTVIYDMKYPGYTKSYIKANLIQNGVWTEIILSIPSISTDGDSRSKLADILNSIQIKDNR